MIVLSASWKYYENLWLTTVGALCKFKMKLYLCKVVLNIISIWHLCLGMVRESGELSSSENRFQSCIYLGLN